MLKFGLIIFAFFLTACTTLPKVEQLPEQAQTNRLFKVEQAGQASLLSIQFEKEQWRWVQTDPLGAPIARVVLSKKGWANDGFVMPNGQARQLFTALAVALNPKNPPFKLTDDWKISQNPPHFTITLPDKTQWQIDELEQ
ncbi:hypothetical protein [uncultured Actinobacillus sp.]|uniref:hypothetical protein n=1 Tax=uncultured Actinobacillus sp. TaxID=417616 RepID=UPI0025DA9C2B|nr:hypothetical protein [uncultured Actinobacillus sp.]